MASYLIVFAVLIIFCSFGNFGARSRRNGGVYKELSLNESLALRGSAMFIIMFSHLADPSIRITFFFYVSGALGVAICFLLSGYGLGKSYQHKQNYLSHFLPIKFLNCLLPYFILYFIYAVFFRPGRSTVLHEILRLQMAGNPLWYLKVQLLMYVFFFVTYRCIHNDSYKLSALWASCLLYCIFLYCLHAPMYWYQTCLFFPMGVWLSEADDIVLPVLRKKSSCAAFAGISLCVTVILYFKGRMGMDLLIDGIFTLSFTLFALGVASYIENSILLLKMGEYSLEIYLIHCLILTLDDHYFLGTNALSYISLTAVVLVLAYILHWVCKKLENRLGKKLKGEANNEQ